MLKIGITGGIGSGKSMVCQIFKIIGIPIFNADEVAKKLMNTQPELISALKSLFGYKVFDDSESLNRKYLSNIVFKDPNKLRELNYLVHPAVFLEFNRWCLQIQHNHKNTPYVIKEAALMFEGNSYRDNDFTVLIHSEESIRIKRVIERDGMSMEEVTRRISNQMPETEKLKKADHIIYNDGIMPVMPQVLALHRIWGMDTK